MDFESLLFFIIVLVIFFSTIRKKLASVKTGDSARPASWRQIIGDILSQISKEMEAAKAKPSAEGTDWERIIPTPPGPSDLEKKEEVGVPQPLPEKEAVKKKPAPQKTTAPESVLPKEKKRAVYRKCVPFRISEVRIRELRKAIVWSEILAPPLALREEDRKSELK